MPSKDSKVETKTKRPASVKNPKRSMTAYKKYVEDIFIVMNPSLSEKEVAEVEERVMALKNQVSRMETAW